MVLPARNETKIGSLGLSWKRLAARGRELMSPGKEACSIITFVEHEHTRMDASYSLQELNMVGSARQYDGVYARPRMLCVDVDGGICV